MELYATTKKSARARDERRQRLLSKKPGLLESLPLPMILDMLQLEQQFTYGPRVRRALYKLFSKKAGLRDPEVFDTYSVIIKTDDGTDLKVSGRIFGRIRYRAELTKRVLVQELNRSRVERISRELRPSLPLGWDMTAKEQDELEERIDQEIRITSNVIPLRSAA